MNPGEDALLVDKGLKNKWRWAWVEEKGKDSKPFGSWCKKLSEAGASFCTCLRKLRYATSGKKVLGRHELDPAHRAAFLQHTTLLPGATTADVGLPASITDRVCDLKIRMCMFIAEHNLSFRLAQPLVNLCQNS